MYNICAPQPVMPPRKVNPAYPPEVERIITKALAKEPEKRYQTANEMLRDFDQLPSPLRASTDEEVAMFVRKLFGAKREERQAALAEALARADLVAKNRMTSPGFSMEPLRQSVHSSVSVLTGTGALQMGEVSGAGTATGVVTAGGASARKRLVGIAAAATGLLLVAAVVMSVLMRRSAPPKPASVEGTPAVSAVVKGVVEVPSAAAPSSTNEALVPTHTEDTAHVSNASSVATTEGGSVNKSKSVSTGTSLTTKATSTGATNNSSATSTKSGTATKPTTPTTPKWKHDPGF